LKVLRLRFLSFQGGRVKLDFSPLFFYYLIYGFVSTVQARLAKCA